MRGPTGEELGRGDGSPGHETMHWGGSLRIKFGLSFGEGTCTWG